MCSARRRACTFSCLSWLRYIRLALLHVSYYAWVKRTERKKKKKKRIQVICLEIVPSRILFRAKCHKTRVALISSLVTLFIHARMSGSDGSWLPLDGFGILPTSQTNNIHTKGLYSKITLVFFFITNIFLVETIDLKVVL